MREGDRTKGIHRNPKKKKKTQKSLFEKKKNAMSITFHKKLQVVGCN